MKFEIETECHCGIGHCDIEGVDYEFAVSTNRVKIAIDQGFEFVQ